VIETFNMLTSSENQFSYLLEGYLRESLSQNELSEFFKLLKDPENLALLEQSVDQDFNSGVIEITDESMAKSAFEWFHGQAGIDLQNYKKNIRRIGFPLRFAAAVVAIILISGTIYLIAHRPEKKKEDIAVIPAIEPGQPGHPGAILYLSSGDSVVLENQAEGTIARQGTMEAIRKGNILQYTGSSGETMYNKVVTGRGRQWQLELPDGTRVWLNASSSIRYPLTFSKTERMVETTGEVYFEVIHNGDRPFRAKTASQLIEDLGTSFNVRAYPTDNAIITTVLKGSVSVSSGGVTHSMQPGQQATLQYSGKDFKFKSGVDPDGIISWKNGLFSFHNATLQDVLDEISRWYDVNIQYKGSVSAELFNGDISRNLTLNQILKGLEQPKVHFKLETTKRSVLVYSE
jgi:transmembrane sensor